MFVHVDTKLIDVYQNLKVGFWTLFLFTVTTRAISDLIERNMKHYQQHEIFCVAQLCLHYHTVIMDPARAWLICPVTVIRVKISERGTEFASIRVTPVFLTMWFDRFFVVVVESGKFSSAMIGFRMLGENILREIFDGNYTKLY